MSPTRLRGRRRSVGPVRIAIPLFDGVMALDAIGPYDVLEQLPGASVRFVGHQVGSVRTARGTLGLMVDATFADDEWAEPDVVVVPGGIGTRKLLDDAPILDWLRHAHE